MREGRTRTEDEVWIRDVSALNRSVCSIILVWSSGSTYVVAMRTIRSILAIWSTLTDMQENIRVVQVFWQQHYLTRTD